MKYQIIPVTDFAQNCSIIWCESTHKAAIIDPGGDIDLLIDFINQNQLSLEKILLTHGHLDHVGATAELKKRYQIPIIGPHKDVEFLINALDLQSQMFNFPTVEHFSPDQWLKQDDQITVGNIQLDVLHCPGHTPGHVVLIEQTQQLAFVGDVLFKGAIGRTDFPRGNHQQILQSIKHQLWTKNPDTAFVPGHGSMSTFAEERKSNPYVADDQLLNI